MDNFDVTRILVQVQDIVPEECQQVGKICLIGGPDKFQGNVYFQVSLALLFKGAITYVYGLLCLAFFVSRICFVQGWLCLGLAMSSVFYV